MIPAGFLEANDAAYRWLVARARQIDPRARPDDALQAVERAATLAVLFHAGRFADGALDQVLHEVGARLDEPNAPAIDLPGGRRRVLHVTTRVEGLGGHTRMIDRWIACDPSSTHAVALVDQGSVPIPSWLQATAAGRVFAPPPGATPSARAGWLRAVARQADLVVLHHYPSDAVAVAAFATEGGPPVAVLDHADHVFWLGSSIADTVISLRSAGGRHAEARRYVPGYVVLPIPLVQEPPPVRREEARRALRLPDDQVVLLSVGRAEKYRPSGAYDFVATLNRILVQDRKAHAWVVGESREGIAPHLRVQPHERLHFVGSVDDPSRWRAAADVYLESFPFGSQTALLEAGLDALPVVPAYAPLFPLLVANDDAVCELLPNPADEGAYVDQAVRLARNALERMALGHELRRRLVADHVGDGWTARLAAIYRHTDALVHRPRAIPETPCSTSDADRSLSLWRVLASSGGADTHAVAIHAGQVARFAGDHAGARAQALRALRSRTASAEAWRLLALGLLGDSAKTLKTLLRR